jgi:hypothetical protein
MGRGSNNLNTMVLRVWERNYKYSNHTKEYTRANQLEETSRTLIDIATGTDAYTQIQGNVYGISLVREYNYNSFTLNRHSTDIHVQKDTWQETVP